MISVIIPHLNQPEGLEHCLASLDAQTLDPGLFEVIVVDNGSRALPVEVIARHPNARLLQESRPGPGPARNRGAAEARGDVFAFIDADCRADPNWLRSIQAALAVSGPGVVLGGDVRIWRSGARLNAIEAYESVFAYRFKLYIEKHGYAGTGNLAAWRSDFHAVGPFDGIEVAEDMEWGRRARAAGLHFRYIPEMVVYHPARGSLEELYVKWDRQILHYRRMAEGEPHWRLRWTGRALLVLASPIAAAFTVLASDRISGLSARWRAIAVMTAVRSHRAATMLSLLRGERAMAWNR
ncbi:glycosyltransferase [Rhodoblastus acidophilus]|uniref:Glycosyltransferase n=1 Tax=Candidatus Rhodoblastus alkanivorans TaxID=2954117 RepID=A0ABS9ZA98_9HYPH|nr:glycosyltransferase [Candidatus Rhodoblastus alkanivorans]MCI4677057.1 glycosyltransferase [Candidatus Rhodoblastus alkanivorans]MCI4684410.1 glycosyltransferase [Candidatus Rhodoblastus alkanivorans]MDI4641731.1 glycosyltransferase [Rhodoblastus acidophilus]